MRAIWFPAEEGQWSSRGEHTVPRDSGCKIGRGSCQPSRAVALCRMAAFPQTPRDQGWYLHPIRSQGPVTAPQSGLPALPALPGWGILLTPVESRAEPTSHPGRSLVVRKGWPHRTTEGPAILQRRHHPRVPGAPVLQAGWLHPRGLHERPSWSHNLLEQVTELREARLPLSQVHENKWTRSLFLSSQGRHTRWGGESTGAGPVLRTHPRPVDGVPARGAWPQPQPLSVCGGFITDVTESIPDLQPSVLPEVRLRTALASV